MSDPCPRLIVSLVLASLFPAAAQAQPPSPLDQLPSNIEMLTRFGERAVWSPDGERIAFVHRTLGDAFEIELESREISCLTCSFQHAGYFRVHYLKTGDFILIGPGQTLDRSKARWNQSELWWLRKDLLHPPLRLDQKLNEGIAVSRDRLMIAWSESSNQYPETIPQGVSRLMVAELVISPQGTATLEKKREVHRDQWPACWLEAQDFRRDDRELIFSCYQPENESEVMGVLLENGEVKNYTNSPEVYDEPEGIFPGGEFTTVECDRQNDRGDRHIDIWKLRFDSPEDYTRLTYFSDYEGYKASNPVISPDGLMMAFQVGMSRDEAGVGYGILLFRFDVPASSRSAREPEGKGPPLD